MKIIRIKTRKKKLPNSDRRKSAEYPANRLDPTDYFYLQTGNISRVNNPNLQPEKTIDYELGFQQVLNTRSSLKISGF